MKKYPVYFIGISFLLLFVVGLVGFLSRRTYSVSTENISMSINDYRLSVNEEKTMHVDFDFSDESIENNIDKYTILWSSDDDNIYFDEDMTSLRNPDNVIHATSSGTAIVVVQLFYDDTQLVAVDTANIIITETSTNNSNNLAQDEEENTEFLLKSLSIENGTINPSFDANTFAYTVKMNDVSKFKINATAEEGNSVLIYDEDNRYISGSDIDWEASTGTMQFYICVVEGTLNDDSDCADEEATYLIIISKDEPDELQNKYLKELSIDSEEFPTDAESLDCDIDAKPFVCNIEYEADEFTDSVSVYATPIDGYEFIGDVLPGTYSVKPGDNNAVVFSIGKSGDSEISAVYYINIIVPENDGEDTQTSKNTSNPTTGDISSFLIFIIMLMSLIASLVVYKKNIENN